MHGIILGSGTGVPSLRRNAPGYFLQIDDQQYLIDCGSGTLLQLERVKQSFKNLDTLLITHIHADHIGDLIPLIHALRLPGLERKKPLTFYGPPGFIEFFQQIVVPVVAPPTAFPVIIQEASAAWQIGTTKITSCPTPHSDRFASRAYRIEHQGLSILFSGDTDFDQNLVHFCQDADLLFLDCSTLDANKVTGHLSAGLCGRIAQEAKAKRLILTHFYPIEGPDSQFYDQCRQYYSGPLELAEDLQPFAPTESITSEKRATVDCDAVALE